MSGLFSNRGVTDFYKWQPERGTRLYKLDRATGVFSEYVTEALFCFHTVNTFEDGADTVMDFLVYDDASVTVFTAASAHDTSRDCSLA